MIRYKNTGTLQIDYGNSLKEVSCLLHVLKEQVIRLKGGKVPFKMSHAEILKTQLSTGRSWAGSSEDRNVPAI